MRWNSQKIQPDTEALRTSTRMGTFHSVGRRNERILKPSTTSPRFTWINTQSGHKKRKPTTIATNIEELFQLMAYEVNLMTSQGPLRLFDP